MKKSKYRQTGGSDSNWIYLSSSFFIKAFLLSYITKSTALKFNQQKFPDRVSVIGLTIHKRIRELCLGEKRGAFGIRHSSKCPIVIKSIIKIEYTWGGLYPVFGHCWEAANFEFQPRFFNIDISLLNNARRMQSNGTYSHKTIFCNRVK